MAITGQLYLSKKCILTCLLQVQGNAETQINILSINNHFYGKQTVFTMSDLSFEHFKRLKKNYLKWVSSSALLKQYMAGYVVVCISVTTSLSLSREISAANSNKLALLVLSPPPSHPESRLRMRRLRFM
jgi:hypothetical protein